MMKSKPTSQDCSGGANPDVVDYQVERGLRKRLALVLGLVTFSILSVMLTTIYVLYRTAAQEERVLLAELAQSQALVINAVADFDLRESNHVPGGPSGATLSQVRSAFQNIELSAQGKELLLGRVQGDQIEYFLRQGNGRSVPSWHVPMESDVGEPMRRALSGQSGTMRGLDYNGVPVLAAYEPIPKLEAGLVAKISLTDLRRPYQRAAGVALGCTMVLAIGCVLTLHRLGTPLIRSAEEAYADAARTNRALRAKILEQERTESALRASESRFRGFLDNLGDAAFMVDLDGRLAYVNAFAAEMVQRDLTQILGQSFEPLISAESLAKTQQTFAEVISGRRADLEVTLITGAVAHVRMEPHYDSNRRIIGAVGIARDVSERNELVNALRESEQKYSLLLSNLPGMVYRCQNDRKWTMLFASNGAKGLTGYAPDELLRDGGVSFGDLIHPDDRQFVWDEVQKAIQRNGAFELTYRIVMADGVEKRVWERGRVAESVAGADVFLEGFVTDISERDKAERALRESEARFRAMADYSPVGVYLADAAGHNLYVNRTICRFTGLRPEDHAGLGWRASIHPEDRDSVVRAWSGAAERGEPFETEFRFQTAEGQVTWVLSRAVPLRDESGCITGFIGTTTDVTAKKRAEAVLRESEQFIRSALDALSSHLAVIDQTGRIVAVNDAWRRFAAQNFSSDEVVGEGANYLDICDKAQGDDAPEAQAVARGIREVLAGTTPLFEHEYTCNSPTEERWFVVRVTRFLSDGSPRAVIAHEDITARKRAERTLLEQTQLLALVLSGIPHNVFWKDTRSVYLGCNDQFARAAGLASNEEIAGKTDYDLAWTREEADWYRKCDAEVIASGNPMLDIEETLQSADGTSTTILTSKVPLREPGGDVAGVLGIFIDISDRKRTEQRLRLQSAALAAAANAIVITDRNGVIVWTNPAFTALTGYAAEEVLGGSPRTLKSGKHPAEFYREIWKTILSGHVWQGELINRRKNGELYTEEMTITPVRTVDNGITHFVAIKQDISERKRHEEERLRLVRIERETEQLIQAKQSADAANQAKSEFLANMSHELRTPLNGVITLNELLLKTELQPTQRRFALLAKQSGETLLQLINDILDFSKIEAGRLELEEIDLNLGDAIDQVAGATAAAAEAKNLELVCSLHPAVPHDLRGDPMRLKQVLANLMNNAVKFTERGEIHLRVTLDQETDERACLRFAVTDTGIGIDSDRQHLLFQKFSQADTSTTRKYGGTGLGLAICKRIVDAMGGEIGVESAPGAGSTFWFTAPFHKQAVARGKQLAPFDLQGLQVLVVDDNSLNREILLEQLAHFGLAAQAVADGPSALESLRAAARNNNRFGLAIVDYQMPGMDGEQLARTIKTDDEVKDTTLILLSSSGEYDPERFRAVGFAGWITKPVGCSQLLGAIAEAQACAESRRDLAAIGMSGVSTSMTSPDDCTPTAHVLLVEDNEIGQEAARELLRLHGFTCDTVANGKLAVEAVMQNRYDLVLMDCQMPEMDGFEATRLIRSREEEGRLPGPKGRRLPIVALTANALSGDREKCLDAGMDDYLSKPLSPRRLVEVIRRYLEGSTMTKETKPVEESPRSLTFNDSTIDFAALTDRWGNNAAFTQKLLDRFCSDIPPLVDQLATDMARLDFAEAARLAHSIKGAAGYVEAASVRNPAADLEQFCREQQAEQAAGALAQLRSEIERCVAAIQQLRAGENAAEAPPQENSKP